MGREVQLSFYSGPQQYEPSPGSQQCNTTWRQGDWPWNPIGAGDVDNHSGSVLQVRRMLFAVVNLCTPILLPRTEYRCGSVATRLELVRKTIFGHNHIAIYDCSGSRMYAHVKYWFHPKRHFIHVTMATKEWGHA